MREERDKFERLTQELERSNAAHASQLTQESERLRHSVQELLVGPRPRDETAAGPPTASESESVAQAILARVGAEAESMRQAALKEAESIRSAAREEVLAARDQSERILTAAEREAEQLRLRREAEAAEQVCLGEHVARSVEARGHGNTRCF